jgi:hypothetical protein
VGFILKIYFLGLIAFVPSHDGRQMTILLVDAGKGFQTSDGSVFPPHYPVLIASAARCRGDCRRELAKIAPHIYSRTADPTFPSSRNPAESLRRLLAGGGAWALNGSRISYNYPNATGELSAAGRLQIVRDRRPSQGRDAGPLAAMPANAGEKEDFSWVPEISKASPEAGEIDPDCLAQRPKKCRVVGQMTLTEGTFKTYKLAEFAPTSGGGGVAEVIFQPAAAGTPSPSYRQAIADWTAVEIRVPACGITFTALPFDSKGRERRLKLSPPSCDGTGVVEMALLNLPDPSRFGATDTHHHDGREGEGSHFEVFYELSKNRPAPSERSIPKVTGKYVPTEQVGQRDEPSFLLSRLGIPRAGTPSRPICTQAVFVAQ